MNDWVTCSKLLPQLIYPVNLVLWLILIAFFLLLFRRQLAAGVSLFCALLIVFIGSSPLAERLYQSHQAKFPPIPIQESPPADAIVLLSGEEAVPLPPRTESQIGGNRLLHTFRLYKAGKAPLIVISGGIAFSQGDLLPEAAYIAKILMEWGIPKESIVFEGKSRNTRENAREVSEILRRLDIHTVLLVTSALHMPRALLTFRSAGVNAIPSASSIASSPIQPDILDWFPSFVGLGKIKSVLHENLGILVYRLRGWIG